MNELSSLKIFKNIYFLIGNPVLQENVHMQNLTFLWVFYPKKNFDKMSTLKF